MVRRVILRWMLGALGGTLAAAGLVGLFLRTAQLGELATLLGAETAPDHYLRFSDYAYRTGCLAFVWIGSFFLLAATDPERHRALVRLCGWGLVGWGISSAVLGTWIAMPPPVWESNLALCVLAGCGVLWLNRNETRG